jgi:hypothetical protein
VVSTSIVVASNSLPAQTQMIYELYSYGLVASAFIGALALAVHEPPPCIDKVAIILAAILWPVVLCILAVNEIYE